MGRDGDRLEVRMPPAMGAALREAASAEGVTASELVRQIIRKQLRRLVKKNARIVDGTK